MEDVRAVRTVRGGAGVYGAALIAFGAMSVVRLDGVPGIEPLPPGLPGRPVLAALAGLLLAAAGLGLVAWWRPRDAARLAGATFGAWLCLHLPRLLANPTSGTVWVPACEVVALGAAAWALAATLGGRGAVAPRVVFGVTLLAFGLSHVLYLAYVESVIPAWMPGPPRFWALATGAAHAAAGAALLTGVRARLGATLLAAMFGSWVLVLHAPRVAAHPTAPNEWSSLLVALAMCGASWIFAGTLRRERPAPAGAADRAALAIG